jgi:hypothetical protein
MKGSAVVVVGVDRHGVSRDDGARRLYIPCFIVWMMGTVSERLSFSPGV